MRHDCPGLCLVLHASYGEPAKFIADSGGYVQNAVVCQMLLVDLQTVERRNIIRVASMPGLLFSPLTGF